MTYDGKGGVASMSGPLRGTRVLEMANVISGPYAGMLLGDLGAEVLKIELPGSGDIFRQWAGDARKLSPAFAAFNRGKKSVTMDVRTAGGADCYLRLASTVDVVVENFRPGTLDRLGVGYEAVRRENQDVIYCSISGMGPDGPDHHRPTYDAIAQAKSGLWSQFTDMRAPAPAGPAVCDQLAGLYGANGILAALLRRAATGQGQRLDVSMLGAAMAFQTVPIADYLMTGAVSDQMSRPRRSQTYAFLASDGLPFAIHLSTPEKFWKRLTEVVGRADLLSDPRFRAKPDRIRNYDALRSVLADAFATRERADWLARLGDSDIPAAPINTIAEAVDDPQVRHLGMVRHFGAGEHAQQLVGFPVSFSESACEPGPPPPAVGEHTLAALEGIGVSHQQIEHLKEQGAI